MKLYAVYEHWYNYCDQWDIVESYWRSEERAMERVIHLEDIASDKNKNTYWVDYSIVETED